jgi:pyridinium-3,5-bisthiocarboxylic acid mononucleotide nickel chelatase
LGKRNSSTENYAIEEKSTYIDCGSGVAGDMLLGALIGLGLSPRELESTLKRVIPLNGWSLHIKSVERRMWPAWSLKVLRDRPFTSPEKMLSAVRRAPLPEPVRKRALAILVSLQQAEREAHGHGHGQFDAKGLGRIDTLVDVVGCSWGFWKLGIRDAAASALNTGRIAPATARLLARAKLPVFSDTSAQELATPTGTAILANIVSRFIPMPPLQILQAGYGAGTLERDGKPNVLAIYQGKAARKLLKYRPIPYAHAD